MSGVGGWVVTCGRRRRIFVFLVFTVRPSRREGRVGGKGELEGRMWWWEGKIWLFATFFVCPYWLNKFRNKKIKTSFRARTQIPSDRIFANSEFFVCCQKKKNFTIFLQIPLTQKVTVFFLEKTVALLLGLVEKEKYIRLNIIWLIRGLESTSL